MRGCHWAHKTMLLGGITRDEPAWYPVPVPACNVFQPTKSKPTRVGMLTGRVTDESVAPDTVDGALVPPLASNDTSNVWADHWAYRSTLESGITRLPPDERATP
ncbi:unannotated protein [freshwater metagenome]|uniref:Unannotated protein n=1 Tax=freshwater metagenome TaxID=449393 RepID=A0A6J6G6V4_9ZZZZ